MPSAGPSVDELLEAYPEAVRQLVHDTRAYVRRLLPDAAEAVDLKARLISFSYGPGYTGAICTLILSKVGIKLGLINGATLPDPRGLLQGTGKVHKHVPLARPGDLRLPGLKALLMGASDACRQRLSRRART